MTIIYYNISTRQLENTHNTIASYGFLILRLMEVQLLRRRSHQLSRVAIRCFVGLFSPASHFPYIHLDAIHNIARYRIF